jgi:hypothetical protein
MTARRVTTIGTPIEISALEMGRAMAATIVRKKAETMWEASLE